MKRKSRYLSDPTVIIIADFLSKAATRSDVINKLIENGLLQHDKLKDISAFNKKDTYINFLQVWKYADWKNMRKLLQVIFTFGFNDEIIKALKKDKIKIEEIGIDSTTLGKEENKLYKIGDLKLSLSSKLSNLEFNDVLSFYQQAFSNYAKGNWLSANAMIRSFLEGVFISLARNNGADPNKIRIYSTAIPYLHLKGILSKEEKSFLNIIMGFLCSSGSHFGSKNEIETHLRLLIASSIAMLILDKFTP